jgi:2-phospho-L-lactate/phosphoenolpyruvate guanylyltransferase
MKYSALVPVKSLARAKSRLADHLPRLQREALVLDMLSHVVHTLCESELFEQVYVVSADPRVLELVQHWDAEPMREAQPGHNPALRAAALTILERTAWRQGAYAAWAAFRQPGMMETEERESVLRWLPEQGLLTISADLPLLTLEDIQELLREGENHQVVLAGSSDGTGTNALLTRPPLVVPYLFGPNSLPAYIRAANARRVSFTLYQNPHLAFDIDTLEDVQQLERLDSSWSRAASFAV